MGRRVSRLVSGIFPALLLLLGSQYFVTQAVSRANSTPIIISEVAWAGTLHISSDEWIELYNAGEQPVDLTGWTLHDSSGDVLITLDGVLLPGAFFLLERSDDDTVSDVTADQIYTGNLNNDGESLTLVDGGGAVVDTANGGGGSWPAGLGSPDYVSMERASPEATDDEAGWKSNDQITTNGHDAGENPIRGTPGAPNSSWISTPDDVPDLAVSLAAPGTAVAGERLRYEIQVENVGSVEATDVTITATLAPGLLYAEDDSGMAPDVTQPRRPVWDAGVVSAGNELTFVLTATVALTVEGAILTELSASSPGEVPPADNTAQAETVVVPSATPSVLIGALLYDGYEYGDADEAVQLINLESVTVNLGGWTLADGRSDVTLDSGVSIGPGGSIWLAQDASAFARQFGFAPDVVPESWPGFANTGDEVLLYGPYDNLVDSLVYKNGDTGAGNWVGPAVWPYGGSGLFAEEGQLLFRRRDENSGLPVADSNQNADWAQMTSDVVQGRKVQYPGWNMERFFQPAVSGGSETITIAVAPDSGYELVVQQIESARDTIEIEVLTLENVAIGRALEEAAARGVAVTVLLEGAPVGGIDDHERYNCRQLEQSGGQCWFMVREDDQDIHDRYRYLHAKFMIVDGERALIGSENLSPFSLPDDDKADGTWGRRGVLVVTSAPEIVDRLSELFFDDLAPADHIDLFRWEGSHSHYGAPPDGFTPITVTGGTTYTVRHLQPVRINDVNSLSLFHAPENILRDSQGLLALLNEAGAGDRVLVQQLTERPHWGGASGNADDAPNPRLEAYIDAARRGATVSLLLDSHFDESGNRLSNSATCDYLRDLVEREHLRIRCAVANPTGLGIHNKMVLLNVGGRGWVLVGSWNGTEQSTKGNREVLLQLQSDGAYEYLASLFQQDWPHANWLPLIASNFYGPRDYPLVSEFLYDPTGSDEAEFIEINNPTPNPIDLSGWSVSDAVTPDDFEDLRRFPPGTMLGAREALVVAVSAVSFEEQFGLVPDFEILDSSAHVPDLQDDMDWGDPAAFLQLGNEGDEILLRSPDGKVIDVVTYGAGSYPGIVPCPLVAAAGYSLERLPYWLDTDNCAADFRSWPVPSPGRLPSR